MCTRADAALPTHTPTTAPYLPGYYAQYPQFMPHPAMAVARTSPWQQHAGYMTMIQQPLVYPYVTCALDVCRAPRAPFHAFVIL